MPDPTPSPAERFKARYVTGSCLREQECPPDSGMKCKACLLSGEIAYLLATARAEALEAAAKATCLWCREGMTHVACEADAIRALTAGGGA